MIGGNRMDIVDGTQVMLGSGSATASLFGFSPIIAITWRENPERPSNTCSFSFNFAAKSGKPFVSSDTRGTISAITKAMINVTPLTSSTAASGRGT